MMSQNSRNWISMVVETLPEHSEYIGNELKNSMESLPNSITKVDAHVCALVAAIVSGNGDLGFEIGMSSELMGTNEREDGKAAAALVSYASTQYTGLNSVLNVKPERYNIDEFVDYKKYVNDQQFFLYLLAGAVALRDVVLISSIKNKVGISTEDLCHIVTISSLVASIGKIAL